MKKNKFCPSYGLRTAICVLICLYANILLFCDLLLCRARGTYRVMGYNTHCYSTCLFDFLRYICVESRFRVKRFPCVASSVHLSTKAAGVFSEVDKFSD